MNLITMHQSEIIVPERRLLVIDDHPMVRMTIVRILQKTYRDIVEAADFSTAQKAIAELPPLGIIISDLELKSGSTPEEGLELARSSREQRDRLHQIFVLQTGTEKGTAIAHIEDALKTGLIDGFVRKPFTSLELKSSIQNALDNKFSNSCPASQNE